MCFPCETSVGGALPQFETCGPGEPRPGVGPRKRMCNELFNSRLGPRKGHRATWCHRVMWKEDLPSEGNNHGGHYNQLQFTDNLLTTHNGYHNTTHEQFLNSVSKLIRCNACTDGGSYDQHHNGPVELVRVAKDATKRNHAYLEVGNRALAGTVNKIVCTLEASLVNSQVITQQ